MAPTVAQVSPPPTRLPDLTPEQAREFERAGTQTAIESLPGIAQYAAARDSIRAGSQVLPALQAGDYKGAAEAAIESTAAALSAIPGVHALPVFGGVIAGMNAATVDRQALAMAQKLDEAGHDARTIWSQTGWFKGPDDKWRFEIDDSKMTFSRTAEQGGFKIKADDVGRAVDHPELLAAYPDLAKVKVNAGARATSGEYFGPSSSGGERISVGPNSDAGERSVALHELQHAIQRREGFATGGNALDTARNYPDELAREQADILSNAPPRRSAFDYPMTPERAYDMAAHRLYERLAGEAEARAVQARADMTPEQRAATFPLDSYDVPIDRLIINGGPTAADRAAASLEALSDPSAWGKP